MAGIWTQQGIDYLKKIVADKKPLSFDYAMLNLSDVSDSSIKLHPSVTDLPQPYDEKLPVSLYRDDASGIVFAEIIIPPMFGIPDSKYINGIGLFKDDKLVYIQQYYPQLLKNTDSKRIRIKLNFSTFGGAVNIETIAFAFTTVENKEIVLSGEEEKEVPFKSEIKNVVLYEKDSSGFLKPTTGIEYKIKGKSVAVKNTASEEKTVVVSATIFCQPIPDGITIEDISQVKENVYVGATPPPPSEGYKMFFHEDNKELYFANTSENAWIPLFGGIKDFVKNNKIPILEAEALFLASTYALTYYELYDCEDLTDFDALSTINCSVSSPYLYMECSKGESYLGLKPIMFTESGEKKVIVSVIGEGNFKIQANYGYGWVEFSKDKKPVNIGDILSLSIRIYAPPDIILTRLWGIIILANKEFSDA